MSHKKCAILCCTSTSKRMFTFPKPFVNRERYLQWLAATGNTNLLKVPENKICNRTICEDHFEDKYKFSKKLSKDAIPTLLLPEPLNFEEHYPQNAEMLMTATASVEPVYVSNNACEVNEHEEDQMDRIYQDYEEHEDDNRLEPLNLEEHYPQDAGMSMTATASVEPVYISNDACEVNEHEENQVDLVYQDQEKHEDDNRLGTLCEKGKKLNNLSQISRTSIKHPSKQVLKRKERVPILQLFQVSKNVHLQAKERKIYNFIVSLTRTVRRCKQRKDDLLKRLHQAEKLLKDQPLNIFNELPQPAKDFFICHLRNMGKNKYKRIYTFEDKAFALTLYKKSPTTYRYMARIFHLPSRELLRKFLLKVPITPGICDSIFEEIKHRVEAFDDEKYKYCILIFDEMKLDVSLNFNSAADLIEGYVDNGHNRKMELADHVLVWMLKGIYGTCPWKQPVAFSFCKGTTPWEDIVHSFKNIVTRAQNVGLTIVASVCDQGSTNSKAIENLILDSKRHALISNETLTDNVIIINNQRIVPLYDPPHLLKCIRNNLLTKDLKYKLKDDEIVRIAKWQHVEDAYFIDCSNGHLRIMRKLTDFHVVPNKIKKMKVSCCTQIFSRTVASVMSLMSCSESRSSCGSKYMSLEGKDTAELLLFFNTLFDSVNGTIDIGNDKYDQLWNDAITVFRTMEYEKRKPHDKKTPNVLKNWIHTIQGFKLLTKYFKELGFTQLVTRAFNQDPVENFFGQVRQHGVRNTNPNCSAFQGYYKSLLINAYVKSSSVYENCESDTSRYLINLRQFLQSPISQENQITNILPNIETPDEYEINNNVILSIQNFKLQKVMSQFFTNNCETCSMNNNLLEQNTTFMNRMANIELITRYYLPLISHFPQFSNYIKQDVMQKIDFDFLECAHSMSMKKTLIYKYIDHVIVEYFEIIRKILKGSLRSFPTNTDDVLIKLAQHYFIKHSKKV
ncbi:uncharacterized protein [Temnothorax nylanderi]|uniref:uncharacterized protein n=1 Tax=Temnothorax nylanderi TaxID=102681 RepID=UPI003A8B20A8